MIKNVLTAFIFTVITGISMELSAQEFSGLDKSPADIAYYRPSRGATPIMKVVYSRPQLKGRQIGVDLARYGEVWRTGANEATEIRFYQEVMLGDQAIPAGTYTLFTIPGKSEWTIILNTATDVWGAYDYEETNDVVRFKVPANTAKQSLDAFSMAFTPVANGADLHIGWGKVRVSIPFRTAE